MSSNKEIAEQGSLVDDKKIKFKESKNVRKTKNWCSIVSASFIVLVMLVLVAVAVIYIVKTPRVSKNLYSLPINGYLTFICMDDIIITQNNDNEIETKFKTLFEKLIMLKNNHTESIGLYSGQIFDSNGEFKTGYKDPLTKFLNDANKVGVSIGLVIPIEMLDSPKYMDNVIRLPFMAYYHYSNHLSGINSVNEKIIKFGEQAHNKNSKYYPKKSNNIIFMESDISTSYQPATFHRQVDGIVLPVDLFVSITNIGYPPDTRMMFLPYSVDFKSQCQIHEYPEYELYSLSLTSSIFLSNASALMYQNNSYYPYITPPQNVAGEKDIMSTTEYINEFYNIKQKYKIWQSVIPKVTHQDILIGGTSTGYRVSIFNVTQTTEEYKYYTHLVLLQKNKNDNNEKGISLENVDDLNKDMVATVLIYYPGKLLPRRKPVIKINNIVLSYGESIVLAIHNKDYKYDPSTVANQWPIVVPS